MNRLKLFYYEVKNYQPYLLHFWIYYICSLISGQVRFLWAVYFAFWGTVAWLIVKRVVKNGWISGVIGFGIGIWFSFILGNAGLIKDGFGPIVMLVAIVLMFNAYRKAMAHAGVSMSDLGGVKKTVKKIQAPSFGKIGKNQAASMPDVSEKMTDIPSEAKNSYCNACGAVIPAGNSYCPECGAKAEG